MLQEGYGIMPNLILFSKELSDKEKLLYCLISSLCAEKGYCRANNNFFSDKLGITPGKISIRITSLGNKGYIDIEYNQELGNKRTITLTQKDTTLLPKRVGPITQKGKTPITQKGKHNSIIDNSIIDNSISNNINNSIIDNTKTEVFEPPTNKNIDGFIFELRGICNQIGVAYDKTKERWFAKHILNAKEYGDFCEKVGQSRTIFAINILKASVSINYWKGICSGPMKIYQNYSDVYNETKKITKKKEDKKVENTKVAFIPGIMNDD